MRLSDWSSDVCSSDLIASRRERSSSCARCSNCVRAWRRSVSTSRADTRAPLRAFDNTGGKPLNAELIGKHIGFLLAGEILRRLDARKAAAKAGAARSEEHTSELQSLMRISYAVFCLKKKNTHNTNTTAKQESDNIEQ